MKNKIISILFCLLIITIIPISKGVSIDFEPKFEIEESPIALFYYDRGIIKDDAGFLTGLKKVSFKETSLLSINEQDNYGLARVFGLCSNFRIGI